MIMQHILCGELSGTVCPNCVLKVVAQGAVPIHRSSVFVVSCFAFCFFASSSLRSSDIALWFSLLLFDHEIIHHHHVTIITVSAKEEEHFTRFVKL